MVLPKAGSVGAFEIASREKTFTQKFVCEDSCLREPPNCTSHLKVNKSVFDVFIQIVLLNYPLWK
jgi:hypothetical protein